MRLVAVLLLCCAVAALGQGVPADNARVSFVSSPSLSFSLHTGNQQISSTNNAAVPQQPILASHTAEPVQQQQQPVSNVQQPIQNLPSAQTVNPVNVENVQHEAPVFQSVQPQQQPTSQFYPEQNPVTEVEPKAIHQQWFASHPLDILQPGTSEAAIRQSAVTAEAPKKTFNLSPLLQYAVKESATLAACENLPLRFGAKIISQKGKFMKIKGMSFKSADESADSEAALHLNPSFSTMAEATHLQQPSNILELSLVSPKELALYKPVAHILFPGEAHFKSFPLTYHKELEEPVTSQPITAAGWANPLIQKSVVYKGKVKAKALKAAEEAPINLSYLFSFELPTGSQCATDVLNSAFALPSASDMALKESKVVEKASKLSKVQHAQTFPTADRVEAEHQMRFTPAFGYAGAAEAESMKPELSETESKQLLTKRFLKHERAAEESSEASELENLKLKMKRMLAKKKAMKRARMASIKRAELYSHANENNMVLNLASLARPVNAVQHQKYDFDMSLEKKAGEF